MPVTFRAMVSGDYDEVIALWRACEGIGLSAADSRERIEAYLRRNEGMSFVAEDSGRILGAVLCGCDARRGFLHHLAVAGGHRRRGVGRMLVARCLAALAARGVEKCHILVRAGNAEARRFWQAAGWELRRDIVVMSRLTAASGGR